MGLLEGGGINIYENMKGIIKIYEKKLLNILPSLLTKRLNIIVFNFLDMLSHARTEMQLIKNLAYDESAYRSLPLSWFKH